MPLNFDVTEEILRHCNASDLFTYACTSTSSATLVKEYLTARLLTVYGKFFQSPRNVPHILASCDAVISGSTALSILLPEMSTTWTAGDLDIYVPKRSFAHLSILLQKEGYHILRERTQNENTYTPSSILTVITFDNNTRLIDVVVSNSYTALSPIFQFHNTCVMNFISAYGIFCAYPNLTLHALSMVNP
ncbi:hypothetical protein M404DRAFT_125896, partial [Pisolithus tinctorius Marx 270]